MEKKSSQYRLSPLDPNLTRTSLKYTSSRTLQDDEDLAEGLSKETKRRARGDCSVSASTSHTQYFRRDRNNKEKIKRITTDEFCGLSESISGSSDSFRCYHNIEPRKYTKKGLLKRNFLKKLDPIPKNPKLTEECGPLMGWDMAKKLAFLVNDPVGSKQIDRLQEHLRDFAKTSGSGFRINVLDDLSVILDFLVDSLDKKEPYYRDGFMELMKNVEKPILMASASEYVTYFDSLRDFIAHLGRLLLPLDDDDLFQLVSNALLYQLSASDKQRGQEQGAVRLRQTLIAARKVLYQTVARMIALAKAARFLTFVRIAILLACDCEDNCVDLMMENVFENIFYRFNPYFPVRELPVYDINPCHPEDIYVQLGESSHNMLQITTLMLVLVRTINKFLEEHPEYHRIFPCPDDYSQRCFVWAFRYECRTHDHRHERSSLTIIAHMLIHIFEGKLVTLGCVLMADVLTLSVLTEIPQNKGWVSTVNFGTSPADVEFKRMLMHLSVDFLKLYPSNQFMAEHYIIGLMYIIDPELSKLKAKWTRALYADVQKSAVQSLICVLKLVSPETSTRISLIRRITWYIEWYFVDRYDLTVLYWSVRLLQTALMERCSPLRTPAVREVLNSDSIFGVLHLVIGMLTEKEPPLEKNQSIVGLCLRLMTSCLQESKRTLTLFEYPWIKWPQALNKVVREMLNIAIDSLQRRKICSDRWLLSMMNLIWEAIIWKPENRKSFIRNGGIYQLLDLITMTHYPVQCMTLAMICDVMREGGAIGQLITWRASAVTIGAVGSATTRKADQVTNEYPTVLVPNGATIAALIAACFRRDCLYKKIKLDDTGVIQDLDFPLISQETKKYILSPEYMEKRNQRTPFSFASFSLAGSRMSKCYAILQMLSEDLKDKVELADEAYNLYKNIKLKEEDETILVLISHYLTIKLSEVWLETQIQSHGYIPQDTDITYEFLEIGRGWAKSIQQQQLLVKDKFRKMEETEENNLYSFLERARLNTALDALREVKCVARSTDRARIIHALIFDAVRAYHRRSVVAKKIMAPVVQTYPPSLDDFNMIGQNIKIINILPKHVHKKRDDYMFDESTHLHDVSKTEGDEDAAAQGAQGKRESQQSGNSSRSYRSEASGGGE